MVRHRFEQMAAAHLKRMGERIKDRRLELGLSRREVANALPGKTNENAVYRWEKGKHRPEDDTLEALATVLKTTVGYFLTDEPLADASTPELFGVTQLDRIEKALKDLTSQGAVLSSQIDEIRKRLPPPADEQVRRPA